MASLLILTSNSVSNPLTLDLSNYVVVNPGDGLDPADPAFTQRVWSRSLLKEGATLALEQLVEREMQFPLKLGPIGGVAGSPQNLTATLGLVQQINQILETPGAMMTWQPPGASQPTTFDVLSGIVESQYNYRAEQQSWEFANLRVFTQPLGRAAGPRRYATASGVGPLLMITPYASGGGQVIAASTQNAVAGFGGVSQGGVPSGGIFYWGSPSLAGDAPAQLQISYVGPMPNNATVYGTAPYAAVSLLPDQYYQPLITAPEFTILHQGPGAVAGLVTQQNGIASQSLLLHTNGNAAAAALLDVNPLQSASSGIEPTQAWAGQHRLFAIARASGYATGLGATSPYVELLTTSPNVQNSTGILTVPLGPDYAPYDLGTVAFRASESPQQIQVGMYTNGGATMCGLEIAGLVILPDSATWFFNPSFVQPSQYGYPLGISSLLTNGLPSAPYTNTFLIDSVVDDQFLYWGQSQTFAPSPLGSVPSSVRVTPYSRGLAPAPDPKNGLPIIAILGVNPGVSPSSGGVDFTGAGWSVSGASWANPQNLRTMAQVNVLERTRYAFG